MKILTEVRKEDDLYNIGPFWIVSHSLKSILTNNFEIKGIKIPVDYNGNYTNEFLRKKSSTSHNKIWTQIDKVNKSSGYTYYPRGRVRIVNGEVFIHLNSKVNTPQVINKIIEFYNLQKLSKNVSIEEDDLIQGSHYNFELK